MSNKINKRVMENKRIINSKNMFKDINNWQ